MLQLDWGRCSLLVCRKEAWKSRHQSPDKPANVQPIEEEIMRKDFRLVLVALALTAFPVFAPFGSPSHPPRTAAQRDEAKYRERLIKEVRHELRLLPYYTVFDNLAFKVERDKVILEGQVVLPTLKSDAEAAVKSIEGVASVVNNIQVLPVSPMDDQVRRAVYRAIYGDTALSRYGFQAVPSIHIIVNNGSVTLEGVVDSESDKNLANLRANGVPNVFSVKNNLVVGSGK
jgi:osmotically-inducible protein OsmY